MTSVSDRLQKKPSRGPQKQVRLRLVYIDFWSALKLSFWAALVIGIVTVVVAALLWIILNQTGLFGQLDGLLQDIFGQPDFTLTTELSFGKVMFFALIAGALNVVIFTVIGAILAALYNLVVKISGGFLVGFTNS